MIALASLVAGLVFGLGLAISGMTHPDRVLRFLDIADQWDPTLLLVMGGAVAVTVVLFHVVLRSATPLLDSEFHLPKAKKIDSALVMGAVIFGIGWGIGGYCPGPAISLLAAPNWEAAIFLPGLVLGFWAQRALSGRST